MQHEELEAKCGLEYDSWRRSLLPSIKPERENEVRPPCLFLWSLAADVAQAGGQRAQYMQGQAQARVTGILGAGLLVNHSPVWSFAWKPDLEKAWLLHAWGDRRAPKTRLLGPWQQNRKWQKMAVTWELLLRTPYAGMAGGHRHSPLLLAFPLHSSFFLFFLDFIYLFLERGERKEKEERNINVWLPLVRPLLGTQPATQARTPTGNQTSNPPTCRPALNPLSHSSQGSIHLSRQNNVNRSPLPDEEGEVQRALRTCPAPQAGSGRAGS